MNSIARQLRANVLDSESEAGRPKLRAFPSSLNEGHSISIAAEGLQKTYKKNRIAVPVLKGVDFTAEQGKITAIIGQSGSGKSTLLHLLATLDRPDEGEVCFEGNRIDNLPRAERDRFRNQQLGMIFQFYHLLPELSTLENVLAPQMIGAGIWGYLRQRKTLTARAKEMLEMVAGLCNCWQI
jgi:lipoprotein-releasing system ATP-binding protein